MRGRAGPWRVLVPCIALAAGLLFSTSALTSHGTDLRAGRRLQLEQLIAERDASVRSFDARLRALRRQIDQATVTASRQDARVAEATRQADRLRPANGLAPVKGPGVVVTLDDAPRGPDGSLPRGAGPDDVVVHQQDVQAVVNALWAGGATAMSIVGQRIVATSAVRCVGNTLLLQGRVYSPPFAIAAVGDAKGMRAQLDREPGVALFREYVAAYHLGYDAETKSEVSLPAFDGSLSVTHARPTP